VTSFVEAIIDDCAPGSSGVDHGLTGRVLLSDALEYFVGS
jgi:hypothetical protein